MGTQAAATSAAALPSAQLLPFHRRALTHVMILGGSPRERRSVAASVHAESIMRSGPFVAIDCARDERLLCGALQAWMTGVDDSSDPSILSAERGTLYLEAVDTISVRTQRLLLAFLSGAASYGWSGRLICGADEDLPLRAQTGEFLMPLFDDLDKARVDMGEALQGGAA
jgi:DNA-binding NtrC family response regulator